MQFTTVALALAAATGALAAPALRTRAAEWTIDDLTRVCATDGSSCTYDFAIDFDDGSTPTTCSIVDTVADAPDASWYALPCNDDVGYFQVSWGYDATADPPFATVTIVDTDTDLEAFFGVSNPNAATDFGDIGPSPVQST